MKPKKARSGKPKSAWLSTSFANLIRFASSGTYFARIRIGGKLIRRSLETTVLSVAKLKMIDLEKEERARLERVHKGADGKATFDDLLAEYRDRLNANASLKPKTRQYYQERIEAILKSWPLLAKLDVRGDSPSTLRPGAGERGSGRVSRLWWISQIGGCKCDVG